MVTAKGNITTACTRPDSARLSSVSLEGCLIVCGRVMPGVRRQVELMKRRGIIIWLGTATLLLSLACAVNRKSKDVSRHSIVRGRVVDASGRPVAQAKVQARLGLELDGPKVLTGPDGSFVAEATSGFRSKVVPA